MNKKAGLIFGLSFTAIVVFLPIFLWVRDAAPSQIAHWTDAPEIILCEDEKLNRELVENAVEYWTDLGHEFGEITIATGFDCFTEKHTLGAIVVVEGYISQRMDDGVLGRTTTHSNDEIITSSNIVIMKGQFIPTYGAPRYPKDVLQLVVTHEFGHALGYGHLNQNGHMMTPSIYRQGLGSEGLEIAI
jgi:hypothetical protein